MMARRPRDCGELRFLVAHYAVLLRSTSRSVGAKHVRGNVQVLHEWRGLIIPSSVSRVTLCPGAVMCMYLPSELRQTADDIVDSVKACF
jgi:hypothetical protein